MRRTTRSLTLGAVALLGLAALPACSDDADDAASSPAPTTAAPAEAGCPNDTTGPMRVVLVNDDGIINPAIDFMIERFAEIGDLEVTVVAPAEERSGSSDRTTPGGAAYREATSPGGNPGYAVDGFPADAVAVAIDDLRLDPHLIVSGINPGQNMGAFAPLSGTVGVGRTAIRRGVPALAVSGGFDIDEAQFEFGADLAADWIEENCAGLLAGGFQTETLASINIPGCAPAEMGPLLEVPRALTMPEGVDVFASTCDQSDPQPANDVAALVAGYPAITQVEADIAAPA